ncbi:FAR1-related sequence 5-like protein [Tanacetum coccineum]
MKGGEQYVHGMSDDFKNHIRDINAFIGESDAQMLITKMENRKKFVPNFMFQYKVENCELVTMFWADEVDKCNYKELGDIISFDATFRTNKSFMTAHEKQPTMIITDQDGAMKLAIKEVLTESKHRLCMWQQSNGKAKEIIEAVWACQIQEFKTEEGCEIVKVRDKRAATYRTLNTEKGKEEVRVKEYEAEYKVLRSLEDGSVECTCRHFLRYGFLCRHVFCVLKNRDIEVIPEKYILRRWRRDIIPPALRRNPNRYGEKNETIEKLTNEANFVVDECLFLLSKDEDKLAKFVEQLKNINNEVQSQVPKPPSEKTKDVIVDIYAVEKPKQNNINNLQGAINKGEKTNKHTKTTCPSNPKYIAKLARIAAEQATKDATEDAAKNDAAAEQPTRTDVVEEPTNAS